jgi:hypothetical protein
MNTQQDVLDLFDRTIAKLVAAEAINKAMRASGPIPVETKQLVVDAMLAGQQVEVSVPS